MGNLTSACLGNTSKRQSKDPSNNNSNLFGYRSHELSQMQQADDDEAQRSTESNLQNRKSKDCEAESSSPSSYMTVPASYKSEVWLCPPPLSISPRRYLISLEPEQTSC
jgi:hypothetical protein